MANNNLYNVDYDGNAMFHLQGDIYCVINNFHGEVCVQIRTYYLDNSDGLLHPTRRGVTLTPRSFDLLLRMGQTILQAAAWARMELEGGQRPPNNADNSPPKE